MIRSKKDYLQYLEADRTALNSPGYSFFDRIMQYLKREHIARFQRLLRKVEYYNNVKSKQNLFYKALYVFYKVKFKNLSLRLGFSIPLNVFGPGLAIIHYGTIIVNPRAKIGANCRIHACTNIGESGGVAGAPQIGDNVYIGPGVKIFGAIRVADNVAFAANAAVNRDCMVANSVYGGVPAKRISDIEISRLIPHLRRE